MNNIVIMIFAMLMSTSVTAALYDANMSRMTKVVRVLLTILALSVGSAFVAGGIDAGLKWDEIIDPLVHSRE